MDANPLGRHAVPLLSDEELMEEYLTMLSEDAGVESEAKAAAREMRSTPLDDLDKPPVIGQGGQDGKVSRRAPPNPFHSPKLGGLRTGQRTDKIDDPALQNNPLRGRLIVMIGVNSALFFVFVQALVHNRITYGQMYAPRSENSNIGPTGSTLYAMGGLNADAVRSGEDIRLYWSMFMHSGWIHITLNILCQLQYFYMLEPDWGAMRTLSLFYVSAMTGNLLSIVCDPCKTTVGSSGGLFGLMGGIMTYCIEYWYSIPRPLCIIIFSGVVILITLATGLTKSTDTWAHVGGLVGGVLFGFGTVTTPAAFLSKDRVLKTTLRKNAAMRWLQQTINPDCKCGIREWSIRLVAWGCLAGIWAACYLFLYKHYEYQPPGSLTYHGITDCCCCYSNYIAGEEPSYAIGNWKCYDCALSNTQWGGRPWGEVCSDPINIAPPLAALL